jgi:hypothetical protein
MQVNPTDYHDMNKQLKRALAIGLLTYFATSTQELHATSFQAYSFGDLIVFFKESSGHLVSASCELPGCEALGQVQKYPEAKVEIKPRPRGSNPFSAYCTHVLKGAVVIGKDRNSNSMAFCQFKDGSFLRSF